MKNLLKEKKLKSTVIANKVKQSHQIATPNSDINSSSTNRLYSLCLIALRDKIFHRKILSYAGLAMTNYKKDGLAMTESGRSMVEMLGVLAIMGVLSIAGITGYKNAMNSYKVSDTIQRLMRRATILSGQSLLGQNLSLNDFKADDGDYAITLGDTSSSSFTLNVSLVPKSTCENLKEWKIPAIQPKCSEFTNMMFTFNNDLSQHTIDTGTCPNGNVFLSYKTEPCVTETPKNMECTKNSDCTKGQFCKLTGTTNAFPDAGTCTDIGSYTDRIIVGLGKVRKGWNMSWWAADNWCKAQGMNLIDIKEFQIYYHGELLTASNGAWPALACSSEGIYAQTCNGWRSGMSDSIMWNGNTLRTDENGELMVNTNGDKYVDQYSPVLIDLRIQFNTTSTLWSASQTPTVRPNKARSLSLDSGMAAFSELNSGVSALCK